ncbi:MAG TPA: hypothetical protein VGS00_08850, partial [Thermoanaerobaculia bacterium]|nr:hypothetical protein [Thermoanaerobaculia bacterium]
AFCDLDSLGSVTKRRKFSRLEGDRLFTRHVAPDPEMRRQIVALARAASTLGRDVFVLVNNRAEGCSPLTIRALAEMLAGDGGS